MPSKTFTIEITGGEDMEQALLSLEPAAAKSVISRAFNKHRRNIQRFAQAIAPEDTGRMVQDIKGRKLKSRPGLYGFKVGLSGRGYTGGFYPGHVDLGTSRFEPSPFLEDAFDFYLSGMERDIPDDLWRGIERAWTRAAKARL